jgi:hypothetical protein
MIGYSLMILIWIGIFFLGGIVLTLTFRKWLQGFRKRDTGTQQGVPSYIQEATSREGSSTN